MQDMDLHIFCQKIGQAFETQNTPRALHECIMSLPTGAGLFLPPLVSEQTEMMEKAALAISNPDRQNTIYTPINKLAELILSTATRVIFHSQQREDGKVNGYRTGLKVLLTGIKEFGGVDLSWPEYRGNFADAALLQRAFKVLASHAASRLLSKEAKEFSRISDHFGLFAAPATDTKAGKQNPTFDDAIAALRAHAQKAFTKA